MYLSAIFILQNLKKFLEPIQIYEDVPFLSQKWPISKFFWYKPSLLLSSIVQYFKKIHTVDP